MGSFPETYNDPDCFGKKNLNKFPVKLSKEKEPIAFLK